MQYRKRNNSSRRQIYENDKTCLNNANTMFKAQNYNLKQRMKTNENLKNLK